MNRPATPLLDRVSVPGRPEELLRATELQATGRANCAPRRSTRSPSPAGIWAPALGVVELTVALHAVFDTPRDRLIWDVGHQAYPHKILTGRRDRIRTLRQGGGLSGFTKRSRKRLRPVRRGAFLHLDLRRRWALPWRAT